MRRRSGARAYAKVSVESEVISASPVQLIVMLFDGALSAIRSSRLNMVNGHVEEAGNQISKAIDIVNEGLLGSLDQSKNPDISASLAQLYHAVTRLLYEANRHQDVEKLDQAYRIIDELGSAWREISQKSGESQ